MGMARSGRRARPPAESVRGEASSSRRRMSRHQYLPASPPPVRRPPSYSPTASPTYSPPSYSPTSPSYSPTSPSPSYSNWDSRSPPHTAAYHSPATEAYYSRLRRLDYDEEEEDAIGDEGPAGPPYGQDQVGENYSLEEEDDDGTEWEDDYSYGSGSGGDNGVESEQEHDEDDEIGEAEQMSEEGERVQQVVSDASDAENGVEEEQQADQEERQEAPAPVPVPRSLNVAAVEDSDDDDRPISFVPRARTLVRRGSTTTSAAPAPAPPESPPVPTPPESSPPAPSSFSDSSSVIRNVTVENSSAFDCSICYLALKSPIFQCSVGHVVCSPCHDKLEQATNCHVCRIPIPGAYFRCNAMEQVVDSIRVPCPHAAHGCTERLAYHDRDGHARTCAHKPCHCPSEGCSFAGCVQTTLLVHFATVHGWPCNARSIGTHGIDVSLRKGINIVADAYQGTTTTTERYTLVLKVDQAAPVCNTITAFCIHPSNTGTVTLGFSYCRRGRWDSDNWQWHRRYVQSSELQVVCTDFYNGMPGPSSCYPVPLPWEDDEDIKVTVNYIRGS